jgi:hypothetical protein
LPLSSFFGGEEEKSEIDFWASQIREKAFDHFEKAKKDHESFSVYGLNIGRYTITVQGTAVD